MLERLLREIKTSGAIQPAVLARRLGTSPAMIEALLAELERRGLLKEVSLGCSSEACGNCALANSCISTRRQARLWKVAGDAP